MIEFSLVIIYITLVFASAIRLRSMPYLNLSLYDGAFIGSLFFVAAPVLLIYIDGSYYVPEMSKGFDYNPVRDYIVTLNLMLGWAITLLMSSAPRKRLARKQQPTRRNTANRDVAILLSLYIFTVLFTFILSGKASEGHWMDKMSEALQQNTFLILTGVLKNVYRAIIFGFLIYATETGKFSIKKSLYIGLFIVLFDLVLTFNRVTAAYMFVMAAILLRKNLIPVVLGLVLSWPIISYASNVWTFVRANAATSGLSVEGVIYAIEQGSAINTSFSSLTLAEQSGSIFETANILAFAYIVENVPDNTAPLWGWTFFLRPISIFIPSTIWPDKPKVYGTILGQDMMGISIALNSTLFGEVYANFYLLWPLALILALWVYNKTFEYLKKFIPYAGHFGFMVGFVLGRMELTVASIAVFGTVIIIFSLKFIKIIPPIRLSKAI